MYIERTQLRVVATGSCQALSDSLSSKGVLTLVALVTLRVFASCVLYTLPVSVKALSSARYLLGRLCVVYRVPAVAGMDPPFVAVAAARISGDANHPLTEGTAACPIICKELC